MYTDLLSQSRLIHSSPQRLPTPGSLEQTQRNQPHPPTICFSPPVLRRVRKSCHFFTPRRNEDHQLMVRWERDGTGDVIDEVFGPCIQSGGLRAGSERVYCAWGHGCVTVDQEALKASCGEAVHCLFVFSHWGQNMLMLCRHIMSYGQQWNSTFDKASLATVKFSTSAKSMYYSLPFLEVAEGCRMWAGRLLVM